LFDEVSLARLHGCGYMDLGGGSGLQEYEGMQMRGGGIKTDLSIMLVLKIL